MCELAVPSAPVQFERQSSCVTGDNHLVPGDKVSHWVFCELCRRPHVFARGPAITIIVDVEFNAVTIGILIVKCRLRTTVGAQHGLDSKTVESGIGAEQIIERSIFESN